MKDAALHLEVYAPAASGTAQINPMDLSVDTSAFSNNWRLGRLRVAWPALPNLTSNTDNLTVTLQDSTDGVAFANTTPLIQVAIVGVVTNGVAAGYLDCPLPPGLRGPVGLLVSASAGAGNNTAGLITADWLNE